MFAHCSTGRTSLDRILDLAALLMAAILGAVVALAIFPYDMLLGGGAYWDHVVGDNSVGVTGFYAFSHDEWRWPLLYTRLINYPDGANIYYTDAVPAMAIVGKLIYKLTGFLVPYMGVWILVSYMMNSLFGFMIFRYLKLDILSALLSALLLVFVPEFIWRHVHIGLIAQFFIVASIYCYLRFTSIPSMIEVLLVSVSSCFVILINIYIFSMCAAIIVAGLLDALRLRRLTWFDVALIIVSMGVTIVVTAIVLGLLGTGEALPASGGFGQYSMNLLSPFWPQYSIISEPKFLDPIGGQYEGFNYLGLGILGLFGLSVILFWRDYLSAITNRPFIFIILLALIFYAASRIVYVGPWRVAVFSYHEWPIIGRITSTLRSSGRFFWPVGLAMIIAAITILYRNLDRRWFLSVLTIAIVVQVVDLQPLFRLAHGNAESYRTLVAPDSDVTIDLMRSRDVILVFPGALCGVLGDRDRALQIQLLAARAGRPFDGAYINRGNRPCREIAAEFAKNPFRGIEAPRAMLVLMKESTSPSLAAYGLGPDVECREGRYAYFCGRKPLDDKLLAVGKPVTAPILPLDASLDPNGNGAPFLMQGWTAPGAPGSAFRWAEGEQARFVGKLPREVCGAIEFSAEVLPFAFKDYAVRTAVIDIVGGGSKTIALDQIGQQRIDLVLPLERCIDRLDLTFNFSSLRSPLEVGMNTDPRKVTWGFFNFRMHAPASR